MKKRLKMSINGVVRENEILDTKEIIKRLKRKWVASAIEQTDEFDLIVCPQTNVEEYTRSGWSVNHQYNNIVIQLKDCIGEVQIFDINKLVQEKEIKNKIKQTDIFENVIEQAKLIFLTGKYKDYECAFNHIQNRIKYEINSINNKGHL